MTFLYPLLNSIQPGALWPGLAEYRPAIVLASLFIFIGLCRRATYSRMAAITHPVFFWLLAFVFVQVLSVYYSGGQAMLAEVQFWITYPLFVLVSILLISNPKQMKQYIWGVMAGGMFIVVYGIYSWLAGTTEGGRAGAYGLYANSNDYTYIIIEIVPFLYMLWRVEAGVARRGLLAVSLMLCVMGVLLSLSRGGMLALVLEALLIVLLGMKGKQRILLLPILTLVGALAIGYQYSSRATADGENYTMDDSENHRIELWRTGWKMVKDRPLLGVGSRRFSDYAGKYSDLSYSNRGLVSHNTYIEVISGSGLLGFSTFVCMLFTLIATTRRRNDAGPPWLDAVRVATLISTLSIMFRALFSARPVDWSFYVLSAIGIAYCMLQRADSIARGSSTYVAAPGQSAQAIGSPQ